MTALAEIEHIVRTRLRSLRSTLGLSLDDLAARTNLSPSTISRIETGKRTISLDVLLPLATGLQVGLDVLLDVSGRLLLLLGDREITVEAGEAAEFATMTPHAFVAVDEPTELLMIFDRDGQHAHVHRGND